MTPAWLAETLAMCERVECSDRRMTPGPWTYDDGNVFSEPMSRARTDAIIHNIENRKAQIPVPGAGDERTYGFVCTTTQESPFNDTDDQDIATMRNLAPALAARLRVMAEAWAAFDNLFIGDGEPMPFLDRLARAAEAHKSAVAKLEGMR